MPEDENKHYLEAELESLIREDPEMFRFLRQGSLDGVWYWDLENPEIEWMSPEFWRLFGIDPATKEHRASEWQHLIFPEDRDVALANFTRHCEDPDQPYDQIVRYRHADGSTVWVRCRGIAIRDENGKPIRLLGAHNDLTSLKETEKRLRAQVQATALANERVLEALEINKELRAFSYAVSHDIKAPSNTLHQSLNEVLHCLEEGNVDEGRSLIEMSLGTVERIRSQVETLLNYTQVISREEPYQDIDLTALAQEICVDLQSEIDEAGATLSIERLPRLSCDPVHLRALLQNLVSNALKYRKQDEALQVRVFSHLDPATGIQSLSVADNGIGIEPRFHRRIFEMFQRLHTQEDIAGTGLGLSLCQRIVGLYGGDMKVDSKPGEGSTFTAQFPTGRKG